MVSNALNHVVVFIYQTVASSLTKSSLSWVFLSKLLVALSVEKDFPMETFQFSQEQPAAFMMTLEKMLRLQIDSLLRE